MTSRAEQVLSEALALSKDERGAVAARLFDTLDCEATGEVETAWRNEIRRRVQELESGEVETMSWQEAKKRLAGSRSG